MLQVIRKRRNRCKNYLNFQWSLRPITVLLMMFGFRLDFHCRRATSCVANSVILFLFVLHMFFSLIFNILKLYSYQDTVGDIADLVHALKHTMNPDMGDGVSRILVRDPVDLVSGVVCAIGVETIFTIHVFVTDKCKYLWCNLLKIQEELKLTDNFFKKCRTRCYYALFLLLLVSDIVLMAS